MEKKIKISAWIIPGIIVVRNTKTIIHLVSEQFGMSFEEMKQKTRLREVKTTRQAAYFWLWFFRNENLKGIGNLFVQDHSTVIHGAIMINNLIDTDKIINRKMMYIKDRLQVSDHDYYDYKQYLEAMYMRKMGVKNYNAYSHPFLARDPDIANVFETSI